MSSPSHRKPVLPRLTVPLIALLLGCGDSVATSDTDSSSGSSGSTGDTPTTTEAPTTGETETGVPVEGEARYFLRIDDTPVPPVKLEMDKAKSLEVFGAAAAKQIKLIDVNSDPVLAEVLARIQTSCGTGWDNYDYEPSNPEDPNKPSKVNIYFPNNPNSIPSDDLPINPAHDCTTTELGKTYGADWKHSPQFAMVRLLTMTPRNAVLKGTVLAPFEDLFAQYDGKIVNGLTFADVLAAALFCGSNADPKGCTDKLKDSKLDKLHEISLHTKPFISTAVLAATLKTTLMSSHPNIANDQGLLPVTLYDALMDMQPLADKFGPVGDHPGLLMPDDADFMTRSDALTPDFKMLATAESNLRLVDGIDASIGAGSMFISTAATPLAFDFMDEDKVQLLGIAAMPTVDMRMRITELEYNVPSCTDGLATCGDNLPGNPVGADYIWSQPLWSLERIIVEAAYASFNAIDYPYYCFAPGNPCAAGASISANAPSGWTIFDININGFDAPAPQYLWEMLLGVAQVAIHDPAVDNKPIPEGEANPIFALKGLSIGLTAAEMIAQIRPNLQDQASFIANVILGKFWKHNAHLDFYYRRAAPDAPPALFFVHPSDPVPDATGEALGAYAYKNPGFFADAALTTKLSSTKLDPIAESEHEKFLLPTGETVLYIQDDEDRVHRLRFFVPEGDDPTEIVVHVQAI